MTKRKVIRKQRTPKRATKARGKRRQKTAELPIHRMVRESTGRIDWGDLDTLLPKRFDINRFEFPYGSIGDMALCGLGSNSPADMGSGALSAIAGRLNTLYLAVVSGKMKANEIATEVWHIRAHAHAAHVLAHRMHDAKESAVQS